ncbi:hypothetical protein CEXT_145401 [Caerostris extrusa]|uniref:Uncharacterized protein n=1 Tax=Caerostris extrusa TaxID=172846 RepID=A0AAV4P0T6_CAEEX|nr:hypothetical protein CEXT_145401 [Caerostris extrusa]
MLFLLRYQKVPPAPRFRKMSPVTGCKKVIFFGIKSILVFEKATPVILDDKRGFFSFGIKKILVIKKSLQPSRFRKRQSSNWMQKFFIFFRSIKKSGSTFTFSKKEHQ